jgi:hypothetical protein
MYEFYTEPCQVGQIYDATIRRIYSETAVEDISFGAPLAFNANGDVINIDPAGTSLLIGIAVFDQLKIDGVYHSGDRVSVMNIGRIWAGVNPAFIAGISAGVVAYVDANGLFADQANAGTSQIKAGLFLDTPTLLADGTYVVPLELNFEI